MISLHTIEQSPAGVTSTAISARIEVGGIKVLSVNVYIDGNDSNLFYYLPTLLTKLAHRVDINNHQNHRIAEQTGANNYHW